MSLAWQTKASTWTMNHVRIMVILGCNQFAIQEDLLSWTQQQTSEIDPKIKDRTLEILVRFKALSIEAVLSLLEVAQEEESHISDEK